MKLEPALSLRMPLARRLARIMVMILMLTLFLGFIIVPLEAIHENPQIHNPLDGIWWAVSTATTVGYGDIVPVTSLGRVVGIVLQFAGALMFGTLVGTITVYLNHSQEEYRWKRLAEKLEGLEKENQTIKNKLDFLVKNQNDPAKKPPQWGL